MIERTVILREEEYAKLIDRKEAARYLGYGDVQPEEEMLQEMAFCADGLLSVLSPRYTYKEALLQRECGEGKERLSAVFPDRKLCLPGESVSRHLAGCGRVLCACLTLGAETDGLIERAQEESMLTALLTDALANAAVERLRFLLEEQAALDFPEFELNWLFGIGYGDLPLSLQEEFLEVIQAEKKIGLSCNEKNVLTPLKSVTGFLGLKAPAKETGGRTEEKLLKAERRPAGCGRNHCESCNMRGSCMFSK